MQRQLQKCSAEVGCLWRRPDGEGGQRREKEKANDKKRPFSFYICPQDVSCIILSSAIEWLGVLVPTFDPIQRSSVRFKCGAAIN